MTGRSVLVIGGSSGIGLATALHMGAAGDRLTLVARDEVGLAAAEKSCREHGVRDVSTIAADMSKRENVDRVIAQVVDERGLDVVVHTATVMGYGTVEQTPAEIFLTVVDTAIHGTFHVAQAVLPHFRRQKRGTLVIVNSLLGSVTVPNMGAYATAKWGQRAIARTLQQEIRTEPDVHVCIVSPGSTNTPIYYQAANFLPYEARPPIPVLQPERIAAAIAGLADNPRQHVSVPVGPTNPVVITGYRLLPFVFDRIVGPLFKVAALTRKQQGPTDGTVLAPHAGEERVFGHWPDRS
ncbi:SDR family NAD(P)-dependent oxidoreductase [uncultured Jatrophihabitans sp.]|uniref:SDR family NAD(P)-dependent oxidoreductase n=1 Tax=uncultured Jatrophihabitans sp. TaxID=1610747 RepID=UPI0035CB4B75